MLLFVVIVSLLSSFLDLTRLLFQLFLFRQVQQQAGHKRKAPNGRDGTYTGGVSNVGQHGGRRRGQRVRLLLSSFILIILLLLPIVSFFVEYGSRRAR